jgi:transposase-like protein
MNLLQRALLSQRQGNQSKQIVCPVCELPTLFTFHGYEEGWYGRIERWKCDNCGTDITLSELGPIAPAVRVPQKQKVDNLPIPTLKDSRKFDPA